MVNQTGPAPARSPPFQLLMMYHLIGLRQEVETARRIIPMSILRAWAMFHREFDTTSSFSTYRSMLVRTKKERGGGYDWATCCFQFQETRVLLPLTDMTCLYRNKGMRRAGRLKTESTQNVNSSFFLARSDQKKTIMRNVNAHIHWKHRNVGHRHRFEKHGAWYCNYGRCHLLSSHIEPCVWILFQLPVRPCTWHTAPKQGRNK